MARLFRNKYRVTTTRLQSWDYHWNAAYFVTICTHRRRHFFGDVHEGEMYLSKIGLIADTCWLEIPEHFPFVKLGAHIIMPDHVHGIIIIDKQLESQIAGPWSAVTQDPFFLKFPNPDPFDQTKKNKFGPQSQNLASIIRGFKVGVTKQARNINPVFKWQSKYHDHIIRNQKTFLRISNYIHRNPENWKEKQ